MNSSVVAREPWPGWAEKPGDPGVRPDQGSGPPRGAVCPLPGPEAGRAAPSPGGAMGPAPAAPGRSHAGRSPASSRRAPRWQPPGPAPKARTRAARGALWAAGPTPLPDPPAMRGSKSAPSRASLWRRAARGRRLRFAPRLQSRALRRLPPGRGTRDRGQLWVPH